MEMHDHARARAHQHPVAADRGEQGDLPRAEDGARPVEHRRRPARTSLPGRPDVLARARRARVIGTRAVAAVGPLDRDDRLGAGGQRRAGHDAGGLPGADAYAAAVAGRDVADDRQNGRVLLARARDVRDPDRVPVHRAVVERRQATPAPRRPRPGRSPARRAAAARWAPAARRRRMSSRCSSTRLHAAWPARSLQLLGDELRSQVRSPGRGPHVRTRVGQWPQVVDPVPGVVAAALKTTPCTGPPIFSSRGSVRRASVSWISPPRPGAVVAQYGEDRRVEHVAADDGELAGRLVRRRLLDQAGHPDDVAVVGGLDGGAAVQVDLLGRDLHERDDAAADALRGPRSSAAAAGPGGRSGRRRGVRRTARRRRAGRRTGRRGRGPGVALAYVVHGGQLVGLPHRRKPFGVPLAWAPSGEEVWFTASELGVDHYLSAVSLAGKERLVARIPGTLVVFDIWHDGRVLLARVGRRREVVALRDGEAKERDLSWLDYSYPADLSADGKTFLFDEEGVGGGVRYGTTKELTYAVYIRNTDGSPAIRLGEGVADALSPDQKWVIAQTPGSPEQLRLLPTGAGETQTLTNDSINHQWARWLPDGKRFIFAGNEPSHGVRLYLQELSGALPSRFLPKALTQSHLRFRRTDSLWWEPVPTEKDTTTPSREAIPES